MIYELHVGAFTPEGTFRAAIAKLDHLAALGVTAIEIMPVADFPGRRNWGYDGVLPYAPDSSYGRPEDLKALVEAAHARGMMVLLDVVYNHFGPDGNYLSVYAPQFFHRPAQNTLGRGASTTTAPHSRPVREFVDSQRAILDRRISLGWAAARRGARHLGRQPEAYPARNWPSACASRCRTRRCIWCSKTKRTKPAWLEPTDARAGYTAQWNDDVHHVLHTAATGEEQGYYAEYRGDTGSSAGPGGGLRLSGRNDAYRGRSRGEPSATCRRRHLSRFIQNHDQVGNRAFGDRLGALASPAGVRAVAAGYLLLPQMPMLFMGEEWNAAQPFPFFCDFRRDLADAVRKGRRTNSRAFPNSRTPHAGNSSPIRRRPQRSHSAKLAGMTWREPAHAAWLDWYRRILRVRRASIMPVTDRRGGGSFRVLEDGAVMVRWQLDRGRVDAGGELSAGR